MDWSQPLEAVRKRDGKAFHVMFTSTHLSPSGVVLFDTTMPVAPDARATTNSSWHENGRDYCAQDAWYIRNVVSDAPPATRQPRGFGFRKGISRRGANRRYKWVGVDTSRPGTFRRYMLSTIIRKHASTRDALMAHETSGEYVGNKIDFIWAEKNGYIIWE